MPTKTPLVRAATPNLPSANPVPTIARLGPSAAEFDSSGELHRIDTSHHEAPATGIPSELAGVAKFSAEEIADLESWVNEIDNVELIGRERWLALHATDLIARVQEWASDLDAREANLHAIQAQQDIRERKFRLYQQEVETQMAEHNRVAAKLREQIRNHARRLAFQQA